MPDRKPQYPSTPVHRSGLQGGGASSSTSNLLGPFYTQSSDSLWQRLHNSRPATQQPVGSRGLNAVIAIGCGLLADIYCYTGLHSQLKLVAGDFQRRVRQNKRSAPTPTGRNSSLRPRRPGGLRRRSQRQDWPCPGHGSGLPGRSAGGRAPTQRSHFPPRQHPARPRHPRPPTLST
jgi:hypothetical protein